MKVIFLDLDGVVVVPGTQEFLPGAKEKVLALCETGLVYFFSCWAFNEHDCRFLSENFPHAAGVIRKPYADLYSYIDDKLDLEACNTKL